MASSNQNRIQYLINRCLEGVETVQERDELRAYFAKEKSQEGLDDALLGAFYQPKALVDIPEQKQEQILHAIHSLDKRVSPKLSMYWKWAGVAAVLTIVSLAVFFAINKEAAPLETLTHTLEVADDSTNVIVERPSEDRSPAKDVALLEMADGTHIELAQLDSGEVIQRDGITFERTAEGTLAIRMGMGPDSPSRGEVENRLHTIMTPRGGTHKVVLVDGTVVRLNASSKLSFPTSFASNMRQVSLEGEGYFDVAKDSRRPFIVQTQKGGEKQSILVYGTQFNVNAYPENEGIITTLVEGSIKIRHKEQEQLLKPNQQAVLSKGQILTSPADIEADLAWINNAFYFADEPLVNVMEQISRWYDIDISYAGNAPGIRLWGQVSRTKKLSEVLDILRQTNDVRFKIRGKEVVVMN